MGIVNAGMMGVYDDLAPELKERVEDVVLNRITDPDNLLAPTERLIEIAGSLVAGGKKKPQHLSGAVRQRRQCQLKNASAMPWCMVLLNLL